MVRKVKNIIVSISEGLLGKVLYNSKTDMAKAYSEYLLYEPIVRIVNDKWKIQSEVEVGNKKGKGDKQRIDFVLESTSETNTCVAIEVKYIKGVKSKININKDLNKLNVFINLNNEKKCFGFILIVWKEHKNVQKYKNKINSLLESNLARYYECTFETNFKQTYNVTVLKVKNPLAERKIFFRSELNDPIRLPLVGKSFLN